MEKVKLTQKKEDGAQYSSVVEGNLPFYFIFCVFKLELGVKRCYKNNSN